MKKCCLCDKEFEGFGNNPYPLVDDKNAYCCDECNFTKVITARIEELKKRERNE